ncbi:carbonic anhydrase [Litorimonas haliclonae]|uniref:carbonic anhydrase n=1 Tax=Litorimonas haliclonae TaxID=2081977 RepID=UPI0039EFB1E7
MPNFAAGVLKFQKNVYPENQSLFEELSEGQNPEALFITCADSRIETGMITQTGPGDLFICRNAGNIVPPHTEHTGGMTASIEYAVAVLKVPHIVVCGHSGCGAMAGAMNPEGLESLPHVKRWLGFSKAAVSIADELGQDMSADEKMSLLIEQNVLLQLQHLRTHPSVAAALAKGEVELHGWVYDIKTGGMTAYDDAQKKFVVVDESHAK